MKRPSRRSHRLHPEAPGTRHLLSFLVAVSIGACLVAPSARGSVPALTKLDPELLHAGRFEAGRPVTVWVAFRDKGEGGPDEVAAALAQAEASLSPRTRARRERARVWPRVDYHDIPVCDGYLRALEAQGLRPLAVSRWLNRVAVRLPAGSLAALAEQDFVERLTPVLQVARSRDWVEEIEEPPAPASGERRHERPSPDDRLASGRGPGSAAIDHGMTRNQVAQLNVAALHDSGYTGAGVLICILDADFTAHDVHEALLGKIPAPGRRRDFVDGDTTVTGASDPFSRGHGTFVMGCIGGDRPGTYLGTGFGADFALGRTENGSSETPIEMLFWGMGAEWADSLGADIISSSLGYTTFDGGTGDYTYSDMDGHTTDISRAAEIAASKGILVVNAMGNLGASAWHYLAAPADVDGDSLIAVGAIDSLGASASFSSFGPSADGRIKPDLVARGVQVRLVSASGNPTAYTSGSGTSFSTPLVTGVAACLMQRHPLWTPRDVARALRETASRAFRPDNQKGYGIPDALAASRWVPGQGVTPPPAGLLGIRLIGPNPFRLGSVPALVRFSMGDSRRAATPARLFVVDALGRRVREVWSGSLEYGRWLTAAWDGTDRDGERVAAGVYWIALQGAGETSAVRLVAFD